MTSAEIKLDWIKMQVFKLIKNDGDTVSKLAVQSIFELSSELTMDEMRVELNDVVM